jgi:hypothetical protein
VWRDWNAARTRVAEVNTDVTALTDETRVHDNFIVFSYLIAFIAEIILAL